MWRRDLVQEAEKNWWKGNEETMEEREKKKEEGNSHKSGPGDKRTLAL